MILAVRATAAVKNFDTLLEIVPLPQGEPLLIECGHLGIDTMNNFAPTEDGTLLATSGNDGRVRLLDALTGREIEALRGQLIGFLGLAFHQTVLAWPRAAWTGRLLFGM